MKRGIEEIAYDMTDAETYLRELGRERGEGPDKDTI